MSSDGSPHVFRLRDPCYPSQHHNRLDLSDMAAPPHGSLQTHTKEVHGFKATPAVSSAAWPGVGRHPSATLLGLGVQEDSVLGMFDVFTM